MKETAKTTARTTAKTRKAPKKPAGYQPRFSELDQYLFGQATHYDIFRKMGAHLDKKDGKVGAWFTVWAPHAAEVSVIGEFNGWDAHANVMRKVGEDGVYEVFVPGVTEGMMYKYYIRTPDGRELYKADPYAFASEKRPGTASKVAEIEGYRWGDSEWLTNRKKFDVQKSALSIYEVHPGSWMKHPWSESNPDGFYNYVQFAHSLADYVKKMGYTHVELMGIAEHPFDGSWGYQVTGYYAPTSRYGTPKEFKYLVDYLHKNKIGVILDWVPAHFPKDAHGLADFDGQPLYEYADPRKGEHPEWGTKIFDYGKNEVKNFMLANALYWVEEYHVDGLRVDAVASMLYLDYGKEPGQWVPNKNGGNENLEAVEFFKHLNTLVRGRNKGVIMIAEESTTWPKVTGSVEDGGLHFSYKWNMGWMHDFLDYMKLDPYFRKNNHNKMTFAMSYNESEKYILVLSHDEVVHLKCSMLNKMPGLEGDKFKNLMAGYAFMMGHCGKKLLFMGQEFAQKQEWSEERELDWYLLENPEHKKIQNWVKELLHLYRRNRCLYELDSSWEGFEWINANDADRSIFSFIRKSKDGKNNMLFVINFTPVERPDYRVGVPKHKTYQLVLDSEDPKFTGKTVQEPVKKAAKGRGKAAKQSYKKLDYKAVKSECDGRPFSFAYPLAPYGVAVFKY